MKPARSILEPLAIDLCTGCGGWADGLLAEGYRVVGFDIENMFKAINHPMPEGDYQLVLQDVLTIHGRQFREAALIVASPPCQFFSYTAMPWSRAKQLAAEVRADPVRLEKELSLFKACFRIQREAIDAAGHFIPMVVENVRGAASWVGRSRWNYGSFHLYGDVPALMPMTRKVHFKIDSPHHHLGDPRAPEGSPARLRYEQRREGQKVPGFRFDGSGKSFQTASVEETGVKAAGMNWSDQSLRGQDFTRIAAGQKVTNRNPVHEFATEGIKQHKSGRHWFADPDSISGSTASGSKARKAASAQIAKIPLPLAQYIARIYKPQQEAA